MFSGKFKVAERHGRAGIGGNCLCLLQTRYYNRRNMEVRVMKHIYIALSGVFGCLLVFQVESNSLSNWLDGVVQDVVDGDTIKVKLDLAPEFYSELNYASTEDKLFPESTTIKLARIDAPEKEQYYGNVVWKNLREKILNKKIRVVEEGSYNNAGIMIASVWYYDESNKLVELNKNLVRDGMAWRDKFSTDEELGLLEIEAKKNRIGLFKSGNPTPPWIFRNKREKIKINIPSSFMACDSSKGCSKFQNCKEAKYYLKYCGRTELDPDRDGVPCERSVCASEIKFERTFNLENDN